MNLHVARISDDVEKNCKAATGVGTPPTPDRKIGHKKGNDGCRRNQRKWGLEMPNLTICATIPRESTELVLANKREITNHVPHGPHWSEMTSACQQHSTRHQSHHTCPLTAGEAPTNAGYYLRCLPPVVLAVRDSELVSRPHFFT